MDRSGISVDEEHSEEAIEAARMGVAASRILRDFENRLEIQPVNPRTLNELLCAPTVDLAAISNLLHQDRELESMMLQGANSIGVEPHDSIATVTDAVVLLGLERFCPLALVCTVMEFCKRELNSAPMNRFWQRSLRVAQASERSAAMLGYSSRGFAYIGGLLHDLGQIPLRIASLDAQCLSTTSKLYESCDDLDAERECFGEDHCQIGRAIAHSFGFHPAFVDVLAHHHDPSRSTDDPLLVRMISTASKVGALREHQTIQAQPAVCELHGGWNPNMVTLS